MPINKWNNEWERKLIFIMTNLNSSIILTNSSPFNFLTAYMLLSIREMLGVLPVCSPRVLLTLYGNEFEKEPVVGPLKLYFFLKLVSIKG